MPTPLASQAKSDSARVKKVYLQYSHCCSQGLEAENRRAFKAAADYFRKALQFDAGFNQSADKPEEMESWEFVGESLSDALNRAREIEKNFRQAVKKRTTS